MPLSLARRLTLGTLLHPLTLSHTEYVDMLLGLLLTVTQLVHKAEVMDYTDFKSPGLLLTFLLFRVKP